MWTVRAPSSRRRSACSIPTATPILSREQISVTCATYLGASTVIWLGRGLDPEVTSGPRRRCGRFRPARRGRLAWSEDPADWRREILAEDLQRLERATCRGRCLEVHKIAPRETPPDRGEEAAGIDMADGASRCPRGSDRPRPTDNCYLCNGAVIMPTFDNHPNDDAARAAWAGLFPGERSSPLPSHEIILAGVHVHCVTQQQPRQGGRCHDRHGDLGGDADGLLVGDRRERRSGRGRCARQRRSARRWYSCRSCSRPPTSASIGCPPLRPRAAARRSSRPSSVSSASPPSSASSSL